MSEDGSRIGKGGWRVGYSGAAPASRRNLISARGSIPMSSTFFWIIDRILQRKRRPTSKVITKAVWEIHFKGNNEGTLKHEPTWQWRFGEFNGESDSALRPEVQRSHKVRATTQTQNKQRQTSMPWVEFEPRNLAFQPAKAVHALGCAATVISVTHILVP
jgi:hypothetical protein